MATLAGTFIGGSPALVPIFTSACVHRANMCPGSRSLPGQCTPCPQTTWAGSELDRKVFYVSTIWGPSVYATAGLDTETTGRPGFQHTEQEHTEPELKEGRARRCLPVPQFGAAPVSLLAPGEVHFLTCSPQTILGEPPRMGTNLREGATAPGMLD